MFTVSRVISADRDASKSGVNRLPGSPTRNFIAVPPLTTFGGSICPTATFATARMMRRTGWFLAAASLSSRA